MALWRNRTEKKNIILSRYLLIQVVDGYCEKSYLYLISTKLSISVVTETARHRRSMFVRV